MTEADDSYEVDGSVHVHLLSRHERRIAFSLGVIFSVVGGCATFLTTNQGGTVVLLLIAVAFLLMGVQGTPLIKLGGESAAIELERRVRRASDLVAQVAASEGTERAQEEARRLVSADPALAVSHFINGYAYEANVREALRRILGDEAEFVTSVAADSSGFDGTVAFSDGQTVHIQIKYMANGKFRWAQAAIQQARGNMRATGRDSWLLVTNAGLTLPALDYWTSTNDAEIFVQWRDPQDDQALRDALDKARGG